MKKPPISIDRIYDTEAYDILEAFCDDDLGGESDFMMCDKYDRQQVINLIFPIIKKELQKKGMKNSITIGTIE